MKADGETLFDTGSASDVEEKAPPSSEAEEGDDSLLGNAFDAFQEGDRKGFIRSMRAFARAMKD